MSRSTIGWAFVAAQGVLLLALLVLPRRDDWPTDTWLNTMGWLVMLIGLTIIAVASLGLGTALTPTPLPNERGDLTTTGLYRHVRHPIYTGVLAIVIGLTLRSGSLVHLAVAAVTFFFFDRKARWEEARLAETYPDYVDYAESTPRFLPRP